MIGIFDSGHGGLTVLNALSARFPDHDFVYLGDHAAAPYGARAPDEILARTLVNVDWLFQRGCRLVVLACNTASAIALRPLQQGWLPARAPDRRILGVLVPMVEAVTGVSWQVKAAPDGQEARPRVVGLLATPQTVASRRFPYEVTLRAPKIRVVQQACPDLVAAIERGAEHDRLAGLVGDYLDQLMAAAAPERPESLILGCTHYELIAPLFREALPEDIRLLSQPSLVADSLARYLERHPALVERPDQAASVEVFTTGDPSLVQRSAGRLFACPPSFKPASRPDRRASSPAGSGSYRRSAGE